MKSLLLRSALLSCLTLSTAFAYAGDLKPRAEVNFRAGTDRSVLMTEFWAPLAQQSDRVLYGDLRLMGDDSDNREGNLGFGYRQISTKTNSVLGGNLWIDRRRTENSNHFHQLTLGLESLGDKVDLRANGYIQLNSSKTRITPNIGSATPYLAGTGIFYDTNGFIVEEPQDGFDAEIGYRLPVFQKYIDATRVYAGGYHFFGDLSDNTTGFRLRTEAQVNSIFSVGARFQHDGPRGSQSFLEATLRFPFKSKKLYQEHGLKSRLDESPERDIDIVTSAKVDTGLMKPIINEISGMQQRILYVDNTNTGNGDGSKDNPFNTLASAQAALKDNDILYVNRGDGTSTGMDTGITIDKLNIQLVGSGSALTYKGYALLEAALSPIITNTQTSSDEFTGNGILAIGGGDFFVSGITVSGAQGHGIYVRSENGQSFTNLTIANNTTANNGLLRSTSKGIYVQTLVNGKIENAFVQNNNVSGNTGSAGRGIEINTTGGIITNAYIIDNISSNNASNGISLTASGNNSGSIENAHIENNQSFNNTSTGIYILAQVSGNIIRNVTVMNNTAFNNTAAGIYMYANNAGQFNNIIADNNVSSNNTGAGAHGIRLEANNNSTIGSVTFSNNTTLSNAQSGVLVYAQNSGIIGQAVFSSLITNNNSQNGLLIQGETSGVINNLNASNITANINGNTGIYIYSTASQINNTTLSNISANQNTANGIYVRANGTSGTINGLAINNTTTSNNGRGIYLHSGTATSVVTNISISSSNITDNTLNGVYVQKSTVTSELNADFGGGSFGSIGQNRIFNNVGNDFNIDRAVIIARSNWWNNGGAAPTRVTTANGGSAIYTPLLSSDPRP